MAKQPVPGTVKTRLCPPLTPPEAADLYDVFLRDTISNVSGIRDADCYVAYDPETSREFFSRLVPEGVRCIAQGEGDLGGKLSEISERLFSMGYTKVILIVSDTPHLPAEYLTGGLRRLDCADVVLGPCDDGGYYLIGSRHHYPALFSDMPWSTSRVCSMTLERTRAAGLTGYLLPVWYDLDTIEDVRRLAGEMASDTPGCHIICRRTKRAITGLGNALFYRTGC
jgi:rSAM/selenodomain-associated transferase 1